MYARPVFAIIGVPDWLTVDSPKPSWCSYLELCMDRRVRRKASFFRAARLDRADNIEVLAQEFGRPFPVAVFQQVEQFEVFLTLPG